MQDISQRDGEPSGDPLYARKLQEVLGGQWGEISVMMTYLFQGWNCRGSAKYRDMPAARDSIVGAVMGGSELQDVILAGMNPQHAIVSGAELEQDGLERTPVPSNSYRVWSCNRSRINS